MEIRKISPAKSTKMKNEVILPAKNFLTPVVNQHDWVGLLMQSVSDNFKFIIIVLAVLILAYIFRKPLSALIPNIKKFLYKGKGTQVEFEAITASHTPVIDLTSKITEAPPVKNEVKEEVKEIEEKSAANEWHPETAEDWQMNMYFGFIERVFDKAEESYLKFNELEMDKEKRDLNEIAYLRMKFEYKGDADAYKKLESRLGGGNDAQIHRALGLCDEHASNHQGAVNHFLKEFGLAKSSEEKVYSSINLARSYLKLGNKGETLKTLTNELKYKLTDDERADVYQALADYYESTDDHEMKVITLQKASEIKPSDQGLLFKVGYSSSEITEGFKELSLLSYKNAVKFGSKDEAVLNNMGVQYGRLGMPLKAVEAYKKSMAEGGSLAVSNLANNYMNAGFEEEAKKILDKEKTKDDVHKNVFESIANLEDKKEKESKDEKDLLEKAQKQQKFLSEFADGVSIPSQRPALNGIWKDKEGIEFSITQDGSILSVWWMDKKDKFKFEGVIENRGAKTIIKKKHEQYSDKEFFLKEGKGFVYVDKVSPTTLQVMNIINDTITYYTLLKA